MTEGMMINSGRGEANGQTQVEKQLGNCGASREILSTTIDELESNLEKITIDPPPSDLNNEAIDVCLVPLAHRIRLVDTNIKIHTKRISDLIKRMEL